MATNWAPGLGYDTDFLRACVHVCCVTCCAPGRPRCTKRGQRANTNKLNFKLLVRQHHSSVEIVPIRPTIGRIGFRRRPGAPALPASALKSGPTLGRPDKRQQFGATGYLGRARRGCALSLGRCASCPLPVAGPIGDQLELGSPVAPPAAGQWPAQPCKLLLLFVRGARDDSRIGAPLSAARPIDLAGPRAARAPRQSARRGRPLAGAARTMGRRRPGRARQMK